MSAGNRPEKASQARCIEHKIDVSPFSIAGYSHRYSGVPLKKFARSRHEVLFDEGPHQPAVKRLLAFAVPNNIVRRQLVAGKKLLNDFRIVPAQHAISDMRLLNSVAGEILLPRQRVNGSGMEDDTIQVENKCLSWRHTSMITAAADATIRSAMRRKALLAVAALLIIATAATAVILVRRKADEEARAQAKENTKAQQAAAAAYIVLPGVITAAEVVDVPAPMAGIVKAFHAEVGADVYEGQLLAEIQNHGIEADHAQTTQELEKAQSRVNDLESAIAAARLEASRANADAIRARSEFDKASRHYTRQRLLYSEGATPRKDFEKAEKDFKALEAESANLTEVARNAEERVSSLNRDLDAARKLLEGRAADMESATARVQAGQVTSPVSGIVAARRGEAGGEVHPAMQDFIQIATDTSNLIVTVEPSPDQLARIRPGQFASVAAADVPEEPLAGRVAGIEDGKVKIEFANPNALVKPGHTAQVRIQPGGGD